MNDLLKLLVCPSCHHELSWSQTDARCSGCGRAYAVEDGIPLLLLDEAASQHDELEHRHSHQHKREQAAFFDREDAAEFEVNRPHGTPALYSWLLAEKFRRSTVALRQLLPDASVLTVCAGSGMDAEYLVGAGARVITSDISLGAARRARQRAERYGLELIPIVADVEHLPFADRAVDLVYVHDGLHHLERPLSGLSEMARVAGRAVSITEPAQAAVTRVAIRLGLSQEREEAGNRVARLTLEEIETALRAAGFRTLRGERYGMYYKHEPGTIFKQLSRPPVLPLVKGAYWAVNAVVGGLGNKLTVQARREEVGAASEVAVARG
jgi:ubiquinone/menaquinone biosynthesis C-methylase UbiE/uncharacterized protein YbaR (Trm112 family)